MVSSIGISKHEGAGNDFLLMVDLDDRVALTVDEVRWLADRHRGVGADGVITITAGSGGGDVTMRLANADGSPAEISGNGLRCVVHEAVRSGLVAPGGFNVMTGAGLRRVHCDDLNGRQAMASASMGKVRVADLDVTQRRGTADVGNPHLVIVVDDLASVDAESEGTRLQSVRPGGINVEWIQMTGDGVLDFGFSGTNPGDYAHLDITGDAVFAGGFAMELLGGFTLADGQEFNIFNFNSATGDFTSFRLNGATCTAGGVDSWSCGNWVITEQWNGANALDLKVSAVPEPATLGLFASALAALGLIRRRKAA